MALKRAFRQTRSALGEGQKLLSAIHTSAPSLGFGSHQSDNDPKASAWGHKTFDFQDSPENFHLAQKHFAQAALIMKDL